MENKKWKLKLTLLLVSSLTIMSIITISPALPQMAKVFSHVKNSEFLVKLVLTVPALMIAAFSPITGMLIDRHGRLKILRLSLLLYALSGVAGYFLDNIYHILVSRAILGMSVGMSMTIVITLIADYFEGMERQKFVGVQVAFMLMGGILFIGLGGVLADFGWRYPFLIYLSSLLVLPLTIRFLYEPPVVEKRNHATTHIKAPQIVWMLFINTMLMWIIFFFIPVQIPFHLKAIGVEKKFADRSYYCNGYIIFGAFILFLFQDKRTAWISFRFFYWIFFTYHWIYLHFGVENLSFGCSCYDRKRPRNGDDDSKYKYVGYENYTTGNQGKRNRKAYNILVPRTVFISCYYIPAFTFSISFLHVYARLRISFRNVSKFPHFSFE